MDHAHVWDAQLHVVRGTDVAIRHHFWAFATAMYAARLKSSVFLQFPVRLISPKGLRAIWTGQHLNEGEMYLDDTAAVRPKLNPHALIKLLKAQVIV